MDHPDYVQLANNGMPAKLLAQTFLQAYFGNTKPEYPLNPFQMLKDAGIVFTFRPFKNYEGVYIPADDETDIPVVGINSERPITRQRYTAAHELCHHLKDVGNSFTCVINSNSNIERYAEDFAAELLMPTKEFACQVAHYAGDACIELEDVLRIAEYFGVSFQACLHRTAWTFHRIEGDVTPKALDTIRKRFKPSVRRKELGFNDVLLYEQLFDTSDEFLYLDLTPRVQQLFKTEYVFHDSRMEGINIDAEKAAEIVVDLRLYGEKSSYCREENQNLIEVAGLSLVYDYVLNTSTGESFKPTIYETKEINKRLFSVTPCSEFGGTLRESNTLVLGGKFETIDYKQISAELYYLDKDIQSLFDEEVSLSTSAYIEAVLNIHHRLTVIHAFRDGNGRTIRAFTNMLLTRRNLPPVLFRSDKKNEYKDALAAIDLYKDYSKLYEIYFKSLIQSHIELSSNNYLSSQN